MSVSPDDNVVAIPRDNIPEHLQEPEWFNPQRNFYFGVHYSMWRIRFYNTMFWVSGVGILILMFYLGIVTDSGWLYTGAVLAPSPATTEYHISLNVA